MIKTAYSKIEGGREPTYVVPLLSMQQVPALRRAKNKSMQTLKSEDFIAELIASV